MTASSSAPLTRSQAITTIFMLTLKYGTLWGAIGGAVFGTLIVPGFGTIFGLVQGALVGFAVGMTNMVVISLVTIWVFYPLSDGIAYTRTVWFIAIFLTFVVSLIGFTLVRSTNDGLIVARMLQPSALIHLPTVIASALACYGAQIIVDWYVGNAPIEPYTPQRAVWQQRCFPIVSLTLTMVALGWGAFQWAALHPGHIPGQELIVYARVGRNLESYLMYITPDGKQQGRLTYHVITDILTTRVKTFQPQLAPGGQGIVYISDHAWESSLRYGNHFYQLRLDGTSEQRIDVDGPIGEDTVLSPDGQKVVYPVVVSERYVGSANNPPATPDTLLNGVKVYAIDGSQEWCLTCQIAEGYGSDFAWSPDGQRIAFSYSDGKQQGLYVAIWNGTRLVQLTRNPEHGAIDTDPAWSPDGQSIVFTRQHDLQRQIMVMRSDGSDIRQLTTVGTNEDATWSPDGTQIGFTSTRDYIPYAMRPLDMNVFAEPKAIYVMQRDGSDQRRITFDQGDYEDPVWVRVATH